MRLSQDILSTAGDDKILCATFSWWHVLDKVEPTFTLPIGYNEDELDALLEMLDTYVYRPDGLMFIYGWIWLASGSWITYETDYHEINIFCKLHTRPAIPNYLQQHTHEKQN